MFKEQPRGIAKAQVAQKAVEQTSFVLTSLNIPRNSLIHQYKYASHGFAGKFSEKQAEKLRNHPLIDHVVKDYYYQAIQVGAAKKSRPSSESMTSSQTTPWGVNRVRGPLDGTGETAWILDTGIDLDHPDLNVDVNQSTSFVSGHSADDGLGHGTYVAGIVAAENNNQDIVGVAAGATAVAVRVCDDNGGCYVSDVEAGVDYAAGNASSGDVVNMSLGFPTSISGISSLETSINNAADNGLRFAIAAGNDRDDANDYSPARVNHSNVWTVSAYREGDEFAQQFDCGSGCNAGSNYSNPPIDYSAPGEDVPSLRVGGGSGMGFPGTGTEDGTSYAAPHVAGLLLTNPQGLDTDGRVTNDPDNGYENSDLIAVKDYPLQTTVGGPSALRTGQSGIYRANTKYGEGAPSYEWYYRTSPSGSWVSTGTSSSQYSHTFYNNTNRDQDHAIKVEVTSAGETSSAVQNVRVLPECNDRPRLGGKFVTPQVIEPCD